MGRKHEGGLFEHRTRYIILLLGWICLTSIFSNTIALNFTFICMTKPVSKNQTQNDIIDNKSFGKELNYEQGEKSALLWALGFGTFVGVWPLIFYIFNMAHDTSSSLLVSYPLFPPLLYLLQPIWALHGVAYGADFAAIGVITVRWASLKQNGVFIAVLTSFNSLSTFITNPISGLLCESSLGWPAVYYVHAAFGILIFTVWVLFYRDQPEMHKNVSGYNKNPAIITIWFNAFVEIVSALFLLSYGPTYIKYVLNISVEGTGFLVALQGLSFLPFRIAAGFMSDQIKCMNEYQKMILFNTLSLVGASVFYCILGFIPPDNTSLSVFAIATTHAVMAFNVGGFYKCGTFVARQHSHFVISNIQFIKCVALLISPLLVAIFVTDDSAQAFTSNILFLNIIFLAVIQLTVFPHCRSQQIWSNRSSSFQLSRIESIEWTKQWRIIFIILAVSLFVANVAFCLIATDQPAKFTTLQPTKKDKMLQLLQFHDDK
ncbi:hypothetical protein DINM_021995 [Dirofilaria immitis]|nr:hypothetical protein [Dirofilaria immitis]